MRLRYGEWWTEVGSGGSRRPAKGVDCELGFEDFATSGFWVGAREGIWEYEESQSMEDFVHNIAAPLSSSLWLLLDVLVPVPLSVASD